ncbi:MAG: redoxin family protein [Bacteroidaceae bacterium]|nr:redoxin family protein [Bacteroidaceae bacterium]
MKRLIVLFSTVCTLLSCGHRDVVWDQPVLSCSTEDEITIKKVVITDDKTAVHMVIDYSPKSWFRFAKETYIEADGERYAITGADSINLGEMSYTNPETWLRNFILYFEPLPKKTKMFDLLEGTAQGDFTFFNIRQKGVEVPEAKIPADFLHDNSDDEEWPEFAYSEEPVTIHIKALNYKPGMNPDITVWHFNITDPTTREGGADIILNDDGTADYSTKIYLPQHVSVNYDARTPGARYISTASPFLVPGAEITLLMDMNITPDSAKNTFVGCKGYMAGFNTRYIKNYRNRSYPFPEDGVIENAKTVDEIIKIHDKWMDDMKEYFDKRNTPDFDRKHLLMYELRFFNWVAQSADSLFRSKEFSDYILSTRPACLFDDSYLEASRDYLAFGHIFADTDLRGKGPDYCRFLYGVTQLRNGTNKKPMIEDDDLSNLYDRLSGGIYAEIEKNRKRVLAPNVHYLDLADVAPENIQQAILDRYKGKTVMFELWETSCGWCLKGHQEMAPLKEKLKNKDMVFVYLATYSSPFERWLSNTKDIPGEHYYVTEDQSKYISDHVFGSDGVPKYIIFDTQGELFYKQLGWHGLEEIQTEIEKALK